MNNTYTIKFDIEKEPLLKQKLETNGFKFQDAPYTFWRAQNNNLTATLYKSGKLLVQGKGIEDFISVTLNSIQGLSGDGLLLKAQDGKMLNQVQHDNGQVKDDILKPKYSSWIGTDESGKGDYFGPLVVAGVLVDEENIKKLSGFNIQDSKKMKDSLIERVAPQIKANSTFSVVVINPLKYNELYSKFKNLNNLLAWGHARVIENILEKKPCQNALSDKFGNESLIKNALMKNGKTINLEQRTKAESDLAVAAASILARNEFVQRIKNLSLEHGMDFQKGASPKVREQASAFVKKYGFEALKNIAKLHFKTTKELH